MSTFNPLTDLPNPKDISIVDDPGSDYLWGVNADGNWEEYRYDYFGVPQSTGRIFNYTTKVLTDNKKTESSDSKNTCNFLTHNWVEYNSGWQIYEYCSICDEKRKPI